MADDMLAEIRKEVDGLKVSLVRTDELIASDPNNRDLINLKKQIQSSIDLEEIKVQVLSNSIEDSEGYDHGNRILSTIAAIYHSTNVLHDNTDEVCRKTDDLYEKTNGLHSKTADLHSKIDLLREEMKSGLDAATYSDRFVFDEVTSLGTQIRGLLEKIDHFSDAVVAGFGVKLDGIAGRMYSLEQKLSQIDGLNVKMTQLRHAIDMQDLMMVDINGPIHGFSKLRDQVTEIQKSTSMLELESDGLHASMRGHVTDQANNICYRLSSMEHQLCGIQDQGDGVQRLEKRMACLEQKVDCLANIEKKLDHLLGLGEKPDNLAGLHKKLDNFAGLDKKISGSEERLDAP